MLHRGTHNTHSRGSWTRLATQLRGLPNGVASLSSRESSALAHGFSEGTHSLFRSGRSFQHSFFQHCCCLLLFAFFTPTDFPPGTAKIFPLILLGSPFFFELFFAFSHGHCFRGFFLREVPPHNKAFQVILFSWHFQLLAVRRSLSRSPT